MKLVKLVTCMCSYNGGNNYELCPENQRDSCDQETKKELWVKGWIPYGLSWRHPYQPDFPFGIIKQGVV